MRIYTTVLILVTLFIVLPDLYIYFRFMRDKTSKVLCMLHFALTFAFLISTICVMMKSGTTLSPRVNFIYITYIASSASIYLSKLVFILSDIIFILKKKKKVIHTIGLLMALYVFGSFVYAFHWGRFNFQREEYTIEIDGLPAAFDGYKIVQISDLHLGCFSREINRLENLFNMMANENADLIIDTGDMVTNFASEMDGTEYLFKKIYKEGAMLAISGNHDYGDYYKWPNEKDKRNNLLAIEKKKESLGFKLLKNECIILEKNGDKIAFIGIENWGRPPFPQLSDLKKAKKGTENVNTKILLTHDPDFAVYEMEDEKDIDLIISGHTHGAQIGIEMPGIKLSPAQIRFKYWDGLYDDGNRQILVSRGLGCVGMPTRWGMSPSYNIITLKSKKL